MSITVQKNPLLPTLALLTAGAAVGAVLAAVVALPAAMTAVAFSGPLGWLILGPIILAGTANAAT